MGRWSFKNLSHAIVGSGKWETSGKDGWLEIQRRVDVASRGRNPSLRDLSLLFKDCGRPCGFTGQDFVERWELDTECLDLQLWAPCLWAGWSPCFVEMPKVAQVRPTWYHWHCYLLSHSLLNNVSLDGCLTVTSDPVSAEMWVLPALSIS